MCRRSAVRPRLVVAFTALLPVLTACGPGEAGDAMAAGDDPATSGSLGEPTAVFPQDFGAIRTVRELDDGTVLVADPLANALYRVDLASGTRTQVGQEGQGPQEYRQPDAVWPLPGDSTLLVDLGNGRLVALGPDLDFGPTSPLSAGDPREGVVIALPEAVDAAGRIYTQGMMMGGGPGGQLPDSGAVLRVDRASMTADTVARVKLSERVRSESGGPGNRSVSIQPVPLSLEDAWGAAPDGSVVIARSGDYHLEWHRPDGTVMSGSPVTYEPASLGNAEKQAWVDHQSRGGGGLQVGVFIENGAVRMSFGRGGPRTAQQEIDQYTWPETAPPFFGDRIPVDTGGRAWVRRFVQAGEDTVYDVFDASGERVATYTLEGDRLVRGLGVASVYVVSYDDFDLTYLERYDLPR